MEKVKTWIKNKVWITTLFWIIVGVIVEKSCNRIIPEEPVVIKEISDTVKFIHTYDFGVLDDSLINVHIQNKLKNIELAEKYEEEIIKQNENRKKNNSIMFDASFPNAKGYSSQNAAPYILLNMSSLQKEYIDFELSFIDKDILEHVYCLSLKVFRLEENRKVYFIDENYKIRGEHNLIKITNNLPKGTYEFNVGFVLKRDQMEIYPKTYLISKIASK